MQLSQSVITRGCSKDKFEKVELTISINGSCKEK
jgi:hypothetical protein